MSGAFRWHGGKHYLAKRIIEAFPARVVNGNNPKADDAGWTHYVEPYFGGGAVYFSMDLTGISCVVNDISGQLMNFWAVVENANTFKQLQQLLELRPLAEAWFEYACEQCEKLRSKEAKKLSLAKPDVEAAANFFIKFRQSRQAIGKSFATLSKNRTRRGRNEQLSAWLSAIDDLELAHTHMLQSTVVRCTPAIACITAEDSPRTLFYCDCPYLPETRATNNVYDFEMTVAEHEELLQLLAGIRGRFVLSGYPSELYEQYAQKHNWRSIEIEIDNKASSAKTKEIKIEKLWMNY